MNAGDQWAGCQCLPRQRWQWFAFGCCLKKMEKHNLDVKLTGTTSYPCDPGWMAMLTRPEKHKLRLRMSSLAQNWAMWVRHSFSPHKYTFNKPWWSFCHVPGLCQELQQIQTWIRGSRPPEGSNILIEIMPFWLSYIPCLASSCPLCSVLFSPICFVFCTSFYPLCLPQSPTKIRSSIHLWMNVNFSPWLLWSQFPKLRFLSKFTELISQSFQPSKPNRE